jgi:hypothetical protein
MRFQFVFMSALAFIADIASAHPQVEHLDVPDYVVSEVVVPVAAPELHATLLQKLNESGRSAAGAKGICFRAAQHAGCVRVYAEDRSTAIQGWHYFKDPAHADDLFVHFSGDTFLSSYYTAQGKPLHYAATFSLSADAIDASTSRLSIRTLEPLVFVGKEFNAHAMGFVPKAVPVPPSPLDEYKMLVLAARLAGVPLASPD